MNKKLIGLLAFVLMVFVFSCANVEKANVSVGTDKISELDASIRSASEAIISSLPNNTIIAILNFTSTSEQFSAYIVDEIMDIFVNSRQFNVVERQKLETIRKENEIQMSGYISDETMQSITGNLGAKYIISGAIINIGDTYRFRLYAINIETAVREFSSTVDISTNDNRLKYLFQKSNNENNDRLYLQGGYYTLVGGNGFCSILPSTQLEGRIMYSIEYNDPNNGITYKDMVIAYYLIKNDMTLLIYTDAADYTEIGTINNKTTFISNNNMWVWFSEFSEE